jgi:ATP adenylyltransferase
MLNAFPYNNGHVMISPYRHVKDLRDLSKRELAEMMDLLIETKARLDEVLKPHGYNIGLNLGRTAGAGFDRHIHIHIVPRWSGDTNFMPVIARTKVVSDSLDAVWRALAG